MLPSSPIRKRTFSQIEGEKAPRSEKRKRARMEKLLSNRGPILRTKNSTFSNGNYDCYYQFRNCRTAEFDPRLLSILAVLPKNIFQNKTVIDLGCNSGFVTFQTAAILGARKVLGIDIDPSLIFKALGQLRRFKTQGLNLQDPRKSPDDLPVSLTRTRGPTDYAAKPWVVPEDLKVRGEAIFPFNVEFLAGNFSQVGERAEVVFCFSLTKWVHLNGGDAGVKSLFFQVREMLLPGGQLFLEAEDWKGYKLKKNLTSEIRRNFQEIRFRPSQFSDYLVETLGFLRGPVIPAFRPAPGFNRPVQVFSLPT